MAQIHDMSRCFELILPTSWRPTCYCAPAFLTTLAARSSSPLSGRRGIVATRTALHAPFSAHNSTIVTLERAARAMVSKMWGIRHLNGVAVSGGWRGWGFQGAPAAAGGGAADSDGQYPGHGATPVPRRSFLVLLALCVSHPCSWLTPAPSKRRV